MSTLFRSLLLLLAFTALWPRMSAATPWVRLGGFMPGQGINVGQHVFTVLLAWDGQPGRVQVFYEGIPTGIFLEDNGFNGDATANDGLYSWAVPEIPAAERQRLLLEAAPGLGGDQGLSWPYLHVTEPVLDPDRLGCLRQVNEDGFGSNLNHYAWGMVAFKDHLYVGTLNGKAGIPTIIGEFQIFAQDGAEVWRYDGESWEMSAERGFDNNPDAFGVRNLYVHDDKLFAGTANLAGGCEVWETEDGVTWRAIMTGGFGKVENQSIRGMFSHDGYLYVGVENAAEGCEFYRWDGSEWETIATGGFGDQANRAIAKIMWFQDEMWLLLWNFVGYQVFTLDPETLALEEKVGPNAPVPPGNGDALNQGVLSAAIYNDRMYIGTVNVVNGADMYVTEDGVTWRQLADNGIDYRKQAYIWRMKEYRGKLYLGCYTLGYQQTTFQEPGRLYVMDEDENITQLIGPDGDLAPGGIVGKINYGFRTLEVFQDRLFLGTAQCFFCDDGRPGTQIWEYDLDCRSGPSQIP